MYLSLKEEIIPNHGYVDINAIGSNDPTALLCNTNRGQGSGRDSGGDWFAPDGTTVGNTANNLIWYFIVTFSCPSSLSHYIVGLITGGLEPV